MRTKTQKNTHNLLLYPLISIFAAPGSGEYISSFATPLCLIFPRHLPYPVNMVGHDHESVEAYFLACCQKSHTICYYVLVFIGFQQRFPAFDGRSSKVQVDVPLSWKRFHDVLDSRIKRVAAVRLQQVGDTAAAPGTGFRGKIVVRLMEAGWRGMG